MKKAFFDPFDPQALPRKQVGELASPGFFDQLARRAGKELSGLQGCLESVAGGMPVKNLLVTSCYDGEGKTTTSVCAALALAGQADAKVLMVDCNFSKPYLHELFSVSMAPGLCDLLTDKTVTQANLTRPTNIRNLSLVPCGPPSSRFIEALRGGSFGERIKALTEGYDYVIFDGSSVFGSSEPLLTAKHFDGILMVIECERTRWEVAQRVKHRLAQADGRIMGVVLNKRRYYVPQFVYSRT